MAQALLTQGQQDRVMAQAVVQAQLDRVKAQALLTLGQQDRVMAQAMVQAQLDRVMDLVKVQVRYLIIQEILVLV